MPEFDDPKIQAIFETGQQRINRMRAEIEAQGGVLKFPFRCYGCDEMRSDLCMKTGDGLPMCWRCFNSMNPGKEKGDE